MSGMMMGGRFESIFTSLVEAAQDSGQLIFLSCVLSDMLAYRMLCGVCKIL